MGAESLNRARNGRLYLLLALIFLASSCASGPRHKAEKYPQRHRGADESTYVVEKGETLDDIARKFETSPDTIKRENGLTNDVLKPGQKLRIPPTPPGSAFLPPNSKRELAPPSERKRGPRVKNVLPPVTAPKIPIELAWPVEKAHVTSEFGIRKNGKHDGVDLGAPEGSKVMAAADGTVIFSGQGPTGYGNIVVIKHSESVVTIYAHNSKNIAKKGASVKQGEEIAQVGHTGRASAPHCHFEVRVNRVAYDPLAYLPKR